MKHQPQNIQHGFTLIELLVVVAIIAILSAIGIPRMWTAYNLAKDKKVITEMRNIAVALGMYRIDNEMVPQTSSIADMVTALQNARTDGERLTMDENDAWGTKFYYYATSQDDYTQKSFGKDSVEGVPATDEYFDPNADTILISGVFRASHLGTTVVVGK